MHDRPTMDVAMMNDRLMTDDVDACSIMHPWQTLCDRRESKKKLPYKGGGVRTPLPYKVIFNGM